MKKTENKFIEDDYYENSFISLRSWLQKHHSKILKDYDKDKDDDSNVKIYT